MSNTKFSIYIALVGIFAMNPFHKAIAVGETLFPTSMRAGISAGAAPIGGLALSVDSGPLLTESMSVGIELYGVQRIGMRALVWDNLKFMSGLHGGGKLIVAMGNAVTIEPGAELGWNHRLENRIDAGVGINLLIGKAIGGSLKFTCGYLFQ
jgi:hypothetical protein